MRHWRDYVIFWHGSRFMVHRSAMDVAPNGLSKLRPYAGRDLASRHSHASFTLMFFSEHPGHQDLHFGFQVAVLGALNAALLGG